MPNGFVKGRTNNHLTWVMVDATDFATPESALSGATKIKIYGKVKGATGVNFVSSGTGSLTNDIVHVGASALGIYTIALAKADLSDASAAWYDQYIISLSATGAAYQALVVEGGIDISNISSKLLVIQSQASDAYSAIIAPLASMTSDVASAVWAHATGVRVDSRILVIQSQASDAYSAIIAPLASMTSDVASAVWAHAIGARVDSRILVNKSTISDVYSMLSDLQSDFQSRVPKRVATDSYLSDMASDLKSAIAAVTATITASDMSDIASRVWATAEGTAVSSRVLVIKSQASDVYSLLTSRVPKIAASNSQLSDLASDLKSYLAVMSGVQSDLYSAVSDLQSDFQSRVPKRVATDSQLSDLISDVKSVLQETQVVRRSTAQAGAATTITLDASASATNDLYKGAMIALVGGTGAGQVREIVSYVGATKVATIFPAWTANPDVTTVFIVKTDAGSRSALSDASSDIKSYLAVMSGVQSDLYSAVSDLQSDFQSRVPKRVATDSQLSDLASDLKSAIAAKIISASDLSDIASAVWANTIGTRVDSRVLVNQSAVSDVYSMLSDLQSDFQSRVPKRVATDSQLSDMASDLKSAIAAMTASISASDMSDIASRVWATAEGTRVDSRILVIKSQASDVYSLLTSRVPKIAASNSQLSDLASDLKSYLAVMSGVQSDLYSAVSDLQSDFQSRVPKRVATDSQLSDMASDLKSAIAAMTATVSASDMSDIASRVWATAEGAALSSRMLLNLSRISDLYSLASDLQSDFQSRVPKRVATDSQLSDLASDLKSAIAAIAVTVSASDISDIASAVWANTIGARVDSRILVNQSAMSDLYSLASDLQSDFQSRVPKRVATDSQLSDVRSDLRSLIAGLTISVTASDMSDIASRVWATAEGAAVSSRLLLNLSRLSDAYSLLSDLQSDFQSRVPKRVATDSQLSDLASDLKSAIAAIAVTVSASDISDIASAVWANTIGARVDSRILVNQSVASDIYSLLTSRVPKLTASSSQVSDLASDLKSYLAVMSSVQSDLYSAVSDLQSDFQSRVPKRVATDSQLSDMASDLKSAIAAITASVSASDISDIASAVWANTIGARVDSRVLVTQSTASDIYSLLSDFQSDFGSRVPKEPAARSQVSDLFSDVRSFIGAGVPISASDMSDLRSAITAGPAGAITTSDLSDIASAVWADTIGARVDSRLLVNQSRVSDIYSLLSDVQSDFQSRVPAAVATRSQVSDVVSNVQARLPAALIGGRISANVGLIKNAAFANFTFPMINATTGNLMTGIGAGVTAVRRIDAGAFVACANAVAEVSDGFYAINLAASDVNGDVITFLFTAVGARPTVVESHTTA